MPALDKKPELAPYLGRYWKAYHDLQSERDYGLGVGPIRWTAIERYAIHHGMNHPDQFEDLLYYIRHMENAEMGHMSKTNKPPAKKSANRKKS